MHRPGSTRCQASPALTFIDEAVIQVQAGRGGDGCVAFRREKFVPRGGPAGGDGGRGGSVILVGSSGLNTLHHLRFRSLYRAERGRHGEGSNRTGRSGEDLRIQVPVGTLAFDGETDRLLGEVLNSDDELLLAAGGIGGRGNARFATPTQRAPRHAEPGRAGEERRVRLELKLLADVGIIGLPNAGKSSFLSTVSAARPKIADYPFTTLRPYLGVVTHREDVEPIVLADLPGLIGGAAEGAGLGHRFLKHVERCRVLLHFVDLSTGQADAGTDLAQVESELEAFDLGLMERQRLVVGTKLDAADEERRKDLAVAARSRGLDCFEISSVAVKGLDELLDRVQALLAGADN